MKSLGLFVFVLLTASSALVRADETDAKHLVGPPPDVAAFEQCERRLREVAIPSDDVSRVLKTLQDHLHWRLLGDGHLILRPGWYAGYSDMVAARASLTDDDIPVLVSLVGRGKLEDGMRSIGFGVLSLFGARALPCIDAGMAVYPERASDLFAIKGHLER